MPDSTSFQDESLKSGIQKSRLGREYAIALARHEKDETRKRADFHTLLPLIVADMPRELGLTEISFLSRIGWASSSIVLSARPYADRRAA